MDVLVQRCAGLDVHRDSVMATVRVPAKRRRQREQQTRGLQPQTELPGRLPWTEANRTKGSPTRWRFRPPSPLTFRLQPCGGPRSALGKGFNLVALR